MSDGAWALKTRVELCIACRYTPTYFAKDGRGVIARSREVLDAHNIGLWVWPEENAGQKGGGNMLHGYTDEIKHAAYQALRRRANGSSSRPSRGDPRGSRRGVFDQRRRRGQRRLEQRLRVEHAVAE